MLVLTHIVPPLQNAIARRAFRREMDPPAGLHVVIGEDGDHFILEGGGTAIDLERLEDD